MKQIILVLSGLFLGILLQAQEVKWYSFEEAVELNKTNPKKFVIDVYTDWCGWCKVMDNKTFSNEHVADYLNSKFYPVKLDAEQKGNITFGDYTYKYIAQGRRGYHELAAALLNGKMSYPSVVFMSVTTGKVEILYVNQGFASAKNFDEIAKFIGGEHYKGGSWEEFLADYESPIVEDKK